MDLVSDKIDQAKRKGYSIAAAEGTAIAVSLGSLAVAKALAPNQVDRLKNLVAEKIILPSMNKSRPWREVMTEKCSEDPELAEVCDKLLDPTPENLAWMQENKPNITREERAKERAGTFVDVSLMIIPGLLTRLPMQKLMDNKMGVQSYEMKDQAFAKVLDTAVVGTAMLGMFTLAHERMMPLKMKARTVIEKSGLSREKSGDLSNYLLYVQVPNMLGVAANVAALAALGTKVNNKMSSGQSEIGR